MRKFLLILLFVPLISFGQDALTVNNHPKSKGLNFSIKEPSKFERIDGKRTNILFNWLKNRNDLDNRITISISIKEMPKEMQMSKKEWIQYLKFEGGIKDFTTGYNNVNKEKYIVLESYPGFMFNSSNEIQRIDYVRKTHNKMILLFIENKVFVLSMSASTKTSLDLNEGVFLSMVNSIVFPDRYN
tara:strand:- start:52 stop:609 length:558 start_codon:yes stop_codon:yes gene_type:complete